MNDSCMLLRRSSLGAAVLGDRLFAIGGSNASGVLRSVEVR